VEPGIYRENLPLLAKNANIINTLRQIWGRITGNSKRYKRELDSANREFTGNRLRPPHCRPPQQQVGAITENAIRRKCAALPLSGFYQGAGTSGQFHAFPVTSIKAASIVWLEGKSGGGRRGAMFLGLLMLCLLVGLFILCAALVRFAQRVIGPQS